MITPLTLALCWFGNDWHSGQCSRGYKLLCMAMRRAKRQGCNRPLDISIGENLDAARLYDYLVAAYSHKI